MRVAAVKNEKDQNPFSKILAFALAGDEGFEPPLTVLETVALPLN